MVIKLSLDTVDYICYSIVAPYRRNTKLTTKNILLSLLPSRVFFMLDLLLF